jgi:hypothetical protein
MSIHVKHIVIGAGEIGQAIAKVIPRKDSISICDLGQWENQQVTANIAHICIPYSEIFVDIVADVCRVTQATTVIVHSTVPPGTCDLINMRDGAPVYLYYSPVVGRHEGDFGLHNFDKYFAGQDVGKNFTNIQDCFTIQCGYWGENMESLEFAKVMSTTYMYWNLVFEKEMHKRCEERGYNFKKVYTTWNQNYNNGYRQQLQGHFQRPIYEHDGNSPVAGGHCLRANLDLDGNFITDCIKTWEVGQIDR